METGTLEKLCLKPGDVVKCLSAYREYWKVGMRYTATYSDEVVDEAGTNFRHDRYGEFCIVSRATPVIDLTAITTPFGLLDEATQDALRAHGGPYQVFSGLKWVPAVFGPMSSPAQTYRVKPAPKRETEALTIINRDGVKIGAGTVTMINGKPDWSTIRLEVR